MRVLTSDLSNGAVSVYELTQSLHLKKTHTFGHTNRRKYVQKFTTFKRNGTSYLILGRMGLVLNIYQIVDSKDTATATTPNGIDATNNFDIIKGINDNNNIDNNIITNISGSGVKPSEFRLLTTKNLIPRNTNDFFVGLEVQIDPTDSENDKFRACTGHGYCYIFDLDMVLGSKYNDLSMSFGLNGSVGFFHGIGWQSETDSAMSFRAMMGFGEEDEENDVSGRRNGYKIIFGGKDREISIIDTKTYNDLWTSSQLSARQKRRGVRNGDSDNVTISRNWDTEESDNAYDCIHDDPLWIQDVVQYEDFYDEAPVNDHNCFIAASKFGKLLYYRPLLSPYPVHEVQVFEGTIKHISKATADTLIIADSFDNVVLFDYRKREIINRLKIKTGALSTLQTVNIDENRFLLFITSNSDKKLRLYCVEDGYPAFLSCSAVDGIVPELMLVETNDLPTVLRANLHKRSRI